MEIVELRAELHLIIPAFGQAYLWRDGSELTLVDTGVPGSAPDLAAAFAELGYHRADLRRVVLTHWHEDHSGSAAAVRAWGDVEVLAHQLDAPVLRGERQGVPPVLTEQEKPLFERVASGMPPAPPVVVDTELTDDDTIDFGGGARVIGTPGHTDGSIAIHLPTNDVLFTGDIAAHGEDGLLLGPFNTDRARAKESFARLATVPAQVICFGHGEPLSGPDGAAVWYELGESGAIPDPLG